MLDILKRINKKSIPIEMLLILFEILLLAYYRNTILLENTKILILLEAFKYYIP